MTSESARQKKSAEPRPDQGLTRGALYQLYQVLGQLKGVVSEPRHVYALVLLRKKLQPEAETFEELGKAPERIQEYEKKRHELCQEMSTKDASGNPQTTVDRQYVIAPDKRQDFTTSMQGLQREYQKDIDAYQKHVEKVQAFAQEPSGPRDLPKIPLSALQGSLSVEQMEVLFPILVEDA